MTLRDWFAGQALVGMMAQGPGDLFARKTFWENIGDQSATDVEFCCKMSIVAYRLADAMLKARGG